LKYKFQRDLENMIKPIKKMIWLIKLKDQIQFITKKNINKDLYRMEDIPWYFVDLIVRLLIVLIIWSSSSIWSSPSSSPSVMKFIHELTWPRIKHIVGLVM